MAEVVVAGAAFNVRFEGDEDKDVVVLAHQLGGALDVFEPIMPALLKSFRVLRFDSRGHGATTSDGAPSSLIAPSSLMGFARDAVALLDAMGVARAHWIGLSMGAMIGQAVMTLAPRRIGRAVLANTAARLGSPDVWNARIAMIRAGGGDGMAEATEARWFTPEFRAREPEAVARTMRTFRATPVEGYAAACAALRDADLSEAIRAVENRVLVIAGARDPSAPSALAHFVAETIPGASLVTLDTAHISPVEDPEGFAEAAVGFLTAPEPAPRRAPRPAKPAPRRSASKRPALAVRTPAKAPGKKAPAKTASTPKNAPKKPAPASAAAAKTQSAPAAKKASKPKASSPAQASAAKVAKSAASAKGASVKGASAKGASAKGASAKGASAKKSSAETADKASSAKTGAAAAGGAKTGAVKAGAARRKGLGKTAGDTSQGPAKAQAAPKKTAAKKPASPKAVATPTGERVGKGGPGAKASPAKPSPKRKK